MIELPEKKAAYFGLGERRFRTRIQSDKELDSSVWTDTPTDKLKKKKKIDEEVRFIENY